jgi:hypothetical protein
MPTPLFAAGNSTTSNVVLAGGLFVIFGVIALQFITVEAVRRYAENNMAITAVVVLTAILTAAMCCLKLRGRFTASAGSEELESTTTDDIAVDRKISKRSVSTVASSAGASEKRPSVVFHLPSNSMERVGNGDLEAALPDTLRN